jgi:hypothetical protein
MGRKMKSKASRSTGDPLVVTGLRRRRQRAQHPSDLDMFAPRPELGEYVYVEDPSSPTGRKLVRLERPAR